MTPLPNFDGLNKIIVVFIKLRIMWWCSPLNVEIPFHKLCFSSSKL